MLHTTPRKAAALPLPKRLPEATRAKVENAIETLMAAQDALVAYLDRMDGDPELEPSLGFQDPAVGNIDQEFACCSNSLDLEQDVQDEPHDSEPDEASLGWLTGMDQERALKRSTGTFYVTGTNGEQWSSRDADLEAEHDGREPDDDREEKCDDDLPESRPAAE